jgi:hypothetical protein
MRWSILLERDVRQLGALAIAAVSIGGCYAPPTSTERLAESVVITSFDDKADFQSYQSFFVRPEIRILDEDDVGVDAAIEVIPAAVAAPLVAATQANLKARGYTEAAAPDQADLAIEMVYTRSVYSSYYCYYWGDWAYWGYPGYSYYYPYSCSGAAWTSGMLVTHATELPSKPITAPVASAPGVNPAADGLLVRGLWSSGIYGVELDSVTYVTDRTVAGINESFAQSPYFEAAGR